MAYRQDPDLDFLGKCTSEELADLVYLLTFDKDNKARLTEQLSSNGKYKRYYPDHKMYWEEIAEEIQRFGGNTVSNLIRLGKGVLYREILCDVCDNFKVKYEKSDHTKDIEKFLLAKVLEKAISDLPDDEIKILAKELNVPSDGIPKSLLATSVATAAQTILSTTFTTTLYSTSIASLVNPQLITGTVGGVIANTTLGRVLGVAAGPIGWSISGAWLLKDIASPAMRVTVPAVIQIALLRAKKIQNA